MGFRVLALFVLAALIWYALFKYHQRRGEELERRHAKHHGWQTVTISLRQEVWKCPRCRALIETWPDVVGHQGVESPCGVLETEQEQLAELERGRVAAKDAEANGRWSASAVAGGESHSGAVDTWAVEPERPRGELEGAQDDG